MNHTLKTFRKYASAAALAALCVPAFTVSAPAAAQSGSQLGEVVEALRGISTLRANFTQTDRSGQTVSGVLTLKRPGRIRFQYQQGVPLLIVGDGKALTLVDYEVKQVQRWPIGNSPLGAILDPRRDVSKFGTLKPTGNPNVVSVEVRDRKHPEYGIITLIFTRKASAPGGLELTYWVALDSQNKRTTVRLSNQQYGVAVPDSTFRWKDPRPNTRR
ncbi:outer membrane lipoprotein-sorting protein [Novosphingobium chloroacetimidivorans]|uniref:Outer membrane lipoprotein-sorting protein n=1 Tax=Novosphingobium chloroacetimidivorans TaxID=1428314 RepID=A0A7W7KB33_9SPHN|nr:outer membrane lipoprotein carrier protein LolA [Novosphingobium chloroacetimidivorans]MBB4859544.1 outer membrane lipoprotein-sorting protein [Novosphingobium chloroacetimidivorans]